MTLPTPTHALKPLDWFDTESSPNARKITIDDVIRELADSIFANGLLQPVIALDNRSVLAGFRRISAFRLLASEGRIDPAKSLVSTLIYPATLTTSQRRIITATENLQRVDLTDPEIFRLCTELLELNPGWCQNDLARHLNKNPSTTTKYLSPTGLIPEALEAFLAGEFGFGKAYSIVKSPDQRATLSLVRGGATRDQAERAAKKTKDDDKPSSTVRVSAIRLPLGDDVTFSLKAPSLSLDAAIAHAEAAIAKMKAARADGHTAKTISAWMTNKKPKGRRRAKGEVNGAPD